MQSVTAVCIRLYCSEQSASVCRFNPDIRALNRMPLSILDDSLQYGTRGRCTCDKKHDPNKTNPNRFHKHRLESASASNPVEDKIVMNAARMKISLNRFGRRLKTLSIRVRPQTKPTLDRAAKDEAILKADRFRDILDRASWNCQACSGFVHAQLLHKPRWCYAVCISEQTPEMSWRIRSLAS